AIEPGQFIKLETGQEGDVQRIGWRSTRIRTRSNATVIVPNQKLVESVIINYQLPTPDTRITVPVGVAYDTDLRKVERVAARVAGEAMRAGEGDTGFEPTIRYTALAESSVTFDVLMRTKSYPDAPTIRHEFIVRLHERYRAEGIVIPYPVRTLDIP